MRFVLYMLLGLMSAPAMAADPGEAVGIRLAKSGTVHLADPETLRDTLRSVYLAAGTRVMLYRKARRHRARTWQLALTEDGLWVYLRNDGVHYFNPGRDSRMQDGAFAIVERPHRLEPQDGPTLDLTPSEIYVVTERDGFEARLRIGRDKLPSLADDTIELWVPEEPLVIFEAEDLDPATMPEGGFEPRSVQGDLAAIAENLGDLDFSRETRERVLAFMDRKLIAEKVCEQSIEGTLELGADAMLKIDTILSPLTAGLNVNGGVTSAFTHPAGIAFEIDRFQRFDQDGRVALEVRNETIREACSDIESTRRLRISTSRGHEAELTPGLFTRLGVGANSQGLPEIRCRDDYFILRDELVQGQALGADVAALVLAQYGRFTGGARPDVCR